MTILSPTEGILTILVFAAAMIAVTYFGSRNSYWSTSRNGFLYAGRKVPYLMAAFSIAASWIWAPALFVSVQKSYELGLAGLFWFTFPNVIAVLIYAFIGPALRKKIPGGFSIPDWIRYRFADDGKKASFLHKLYLVPYIWYQIMAITVQIFVGGMIINYLSGIDLNFAMLLMLAVGMSYALISGLRASIITDFLHVGFILLAIFLIIPWVISITGIEGVTKGFAGVHGSINILNPQIAFSFGIVTSIGLIAGSIADQQFWQRCFAIREDHLVKAFVWGGIIFSLVPIFLSVLGFIAANPDYTIAPPAGTGLPMIGMEVLDQLLPAWVSVMFFVMLLCGLSSPLDSGLVAGASLYAIDVIRLSDNEKQALDKERISLSVNTAQTGDDKIIIQRARIGMFLMAALGFIFALIAQHLFALDRLWWLFNGVAAMFVIPTLLSIFWSRLSATGVIYGLLTSMIGMVFFIIGNYRQDDSLTVYSALAMLVLNLFFCLMFRRKNPWVGRVTP